MRRSSHCKICKIRFFRCLACTVLNVLQYSGHTGVCCFSIHSFRFSYLHRHRQLSSFSALDIGPSPRETWRQKQPRITLARLHRGYSHDGWCIHHAGCAGVLRCTPISSHRSTPLALVLYRCQTHTHNSHRKVIKVGKRSSSLHPIRLPKLF